MLNAVQCCRPDAVAQKRLLDEAAGLAASWQDLNAEQLRAILRVLVTKVQVHSDRVDLTLDQMGVALWLNAEANPQQPSHPSEYDCERHLMVLSVPARLKRTGIGIDLWLMMDQNRRTSIPSWSVFCSEPTPYAPACLRSPAYH